MDEDGVDGDYQETVNIMDLSLGRAPEPVTSNGEVRGVSPRRTCCPVG